MKIKQRIFTLLAVTAIVAIAVEARCSDLTKVKQLHSESTQVVTPKTRSFGTLNAERTIIIDSTIRRGTLADGTALINNLKKNQTYYVIIDTPGGSVDEGMAFIRTMQTAKKLKNNKSVCIINGAAYSMGAIIASYCHQTYIDPILGSMMYHQVALGVRGQLIQITQLLAFVARQVKIIEIDLASQMGITYDQYKKLTTYEYWLTSEDAVKLGYVDGFATNYIFTVPEEKVTLKRFFRSIRGE